MEAPSRDNSEQPQHQPSSTVYITFKVFQLVNQIRNQLKTRVQSNKASADPLGADFLNKFERHATNGIDDILARTSSRRRAKNSRIKRAGVSEQTEKEGRRWKQSPKPVTKTAVEQFLQDVDSPLGYNKLSSPLSKISVDDRAFLSHKTWPIFARLSFVEIAQLLAAVEDALNIVQCITGANNHLLCKGDELVSIASWDESSLANLEHLLLCLRTTLTQALIRKSVEIAQQDGIYWRNYYRKQRKLGGDSWCSEFCDNQRPLSTTWPWSIRPSLAVLWGVCWMFYDFPRGNDQITSQPEDPDAWLQSLLWATAGEQRGDEAAPPQQRQNQVRLPLSHSVPALHTPTRHQQHPPRPQRGQHNSDAWIVHRASSSPAAGFQTQNPSLPEAATHLHPSSLNNLNTWAGWPQPQQHQQSLQPNLGYARHSPLQRQGHFGHLTGADTLTVPESPGSAAPSLPANIFLGDAYPQATSQMNFESIPDQFSHPHTQQQLHHPPHHQRRTSNSMRSPITPITPKSMAEVQELPREDLDRRLSHSSTHSASMHQPRDESAEMDDALSPGRSHAFRRLEEAPRNHENKMVCKYAECSSLTFERRCEWSKHMDKHDRPYKCAAVGCEKLQGFTYSGGLLRHQREVHKMHGGTKQSLFCPEPTCKRHSGTGFTRKENLAEHMRRVHRQTSGASESTLVGTKPDQTQPIDWQLEHAHSPGTYVDIESVSTKRKRPSCGEESMRSDEGDLREEVKRLRRENEEKDARLKKLEEDQQRITKLEEQLAALQKP